MRPGKPERGIGRGLNLWAVFLLVLGLPAGALAQQPQIVKPLLPLPEGLRHVPRSALAFVHCRVGDLLKSEAGKAVLDKLTEGKDTATILRELEKVVGLNVADVESVTLIILEVPIIRGPRWRLPDRPVAPKEFPKPLRPKEVFPKFDKIEKQFELKESDNGDEVSFPTFPVSFQPGRFFGEEAIEMGQPVEPEAVIVITTWKPYDRKKFLKHFVLPFEQRDDGQARPFGEMKPGIVFLGERSFLLGKPQNLIRYADQLDREPGGLSIKGKDQLPTRAPLAMALDLGRQEHHLVAGGHLPPEMKRLLLAERFRPWEIPPQLATFFPLINVTSAGVTVDVGKSLDCTLHLEAGNTRSANLIAEAAKTLLAAADLGLPFLNKNQELPPPVRNMLAKVRQTLADAKIERNKNVVRVAMSMETDMPFLLAALAEAGAKVRLAGDRTESQNNLKQIGIAMHVYHDTYRGFPAAAIRDKDGKPLLSWRVAILPYIEHAPLYQRFKLDEPWDSPHNKALIDPMPVIYAAPGKKPDGRTYYQVFVGPGSVFEPLQGKLAQRGSGRAGDAPPNPWGRLKILEKVTLTNP